ncbi:MAG: transcriptional regulator [Candidatus Magasanikbacteria bacterium CG10_big_fil_rev_8_21_14_0_10_40_10]|uniref:Transcriptional regulator n=1 Tax=Candidatus Magasanikbacteria bacterium CG10_big_fil_rev_8_21_14_0_10_40_10 TaxID=1974648 RepID=A0A2M6W463_9BACT|nr:MAG: transcriptional regulator [Candidatus Magasanikbacteria bacterium CG10_big_fil_rev_8_21_14_0_10_40_10]
MVINPKQKQELIKTILSIRQPELMDSFLRDILTSAEYVDVVKRLQILKRLRQGRTHRQVARELGVSISKVTRGAKLLQSKNNLNWWRASFD